MQDVKTAEESFNWQFSEPIRLIIWDLDQTFWNGVLTEGGHEVADDNCALVIKMARRGIISSICSKNDFDAAADVLRAAGVWDYFILPSITWEPKGPRIANLIQAIQLRPETVLFIDDNPSNLEEARAHVPGLQTCSHRFIPHIDEHPQLKGSKDDELTRLKRYKVLEQRTADRQAAAHDVNDFLRSSDIRVSFEYDLKTHIDRVVELVNRTNQLNFTKVRLPESLSREEAIRELRIDHYAVQGALVHVTDRYGDHGFCGFYLFQSVHRELLQFCFSCRILGMGVEQWVYEMLGRPKLKVEGEVLTDLFSPREPINWINNRKADTKSLETVKPLKRIVARGACSLGAVIHYFRLSAQQAIGEYHLHRYGLPRRIDHTEFVCQGQSGLSSAAIEAAKKLGYESEDFATQLFHEDNQAVLLGLSTDGCFALYRHVESGLTVPMEFFPGLTGDN